MSVTMENEVLLYGNRYRIQGNVRDQLINPFPAKVVQGDYTRDDETVLSSVAYSTFTGGLGIINGTSQTLDRINFATLHTLHPYQLSLLPRVTLRDGALSKAECLIDYGDRLNVFIGTAVQRWNETSKTFSNVKTLSAAASDVCVYWDPTSARHKLYVAHTDTNDIEVYDSIADAWTTLTGIKGKLLCVWNDTLYRMTKSGELLYASDPTTAAGWTSAAQLQLPTDAAKQLLVAMDNQGFMVVHIVTDHGVYIYNHADGRIEETPLTFPPHPSVGKAIFWRGELRVPVGSGVYKYNGSTIQVVGPDKDEGLPAAYRGRILQLVGSHPYYYAISNVPNEVEDPDYLFDAGWGNDFVMEETGGQGVILVSPDAAWHTSWVEPDPTATLGAAYVSNVQSQYRLWITSTSGVYSIHLPRTVHNPLQNPTTEYQADGFLITPWFDAGMAEVQKLAIAVKVRGRNLSETEMYTISIQFDDESTWTYVGSCSEYDHDLNSPLDYLPLHQFKINPDDSEGGRLFYRCRLKIELERGVTVTNTPVIDSVVLSYLRVPQPVWGYQVVIDLSKEYLGRSPREMWRELKQIIRNRRAGELVFLDPVSGHAEVSYVIVSRQAGSLTSGRNTRGFVNLSCVEIEPATETDPDA